MGSGGLQQTNALFRKNLVIQRRACKTNCCLILFPLILCSAIGGLQIAIKRSQKKDTTVVNCSCNNAIVPENTLGGAVCSDEKDDCPLLHPPKWQPLVQIPPSFRDRYGASCGGGGAQGSCAATFLVTGTNNSFVENVMGYMVPVHDTSVNVPAGNISALADFVLADDSFLQNKCTPNLTLSYAFAYGNVTKTAGKTIPREKAETRNEWRFDLSPKTVY